MLSGIKMGIITKCPKCLKFYMKVQLFNGWPLIIQNRIFFFKLPDFVSLGP